MCERNIYGWGWFKVSGLRSLGLDGEHSGVRILNINHQTQTATEAQGTPLPADLRSTRPSQQASGVSEPIETTIPLAKSEKEVTKSPTTAERDAQALAALLDRDGGPAGFGFEDGKPEGGQRKDVKREMFRLM